ncbi:MAG: hypothetical protein JJE25_01435, partial [Bacteroidia bacterium]|nr:hypothetical protein [Bacteroidia bacterium]
MKLTLLSLFLLIALASKAQSYSGPESAEYDAANNRWLIANTTSHEVIARSSTGTLSVFVGGLGSGPHGIEIVGDTLFCCSGASIKGYLLSNASQVFNLNLGATFLNGITHDNSGNLIATGFTAKKIFKVNISAQTFSTIATTLVQSPNGIVFDAANNRCVFVNWGSSAPIKAIDMTTYAVTTLLTTAFSNCDGISRDAQGRYYVSNWGGQSIVRYDSAFSLAPATVVTGLSNPADIFYNTLDDTLAIPNAGNNTVTFFGFATSTGIDETKTEEMLNVFPNPATNKLTIENGHLK